MALDDVLNIQLKYLINWSIYLPRNNSWLYKIGIRQAVQILLNLTDIFHKKNKLLFDTFFSFFLKLQLNGVFFGLVFQNE